MYKTILVNEVYKNKKNYLLIDVRNPNEFESERIKNSLNIPLTEIENYFNLLKKQKKQIILICKSGARSQIACTKLHQLENIFSMEGGLNSWQENKFKIITGKKVWGLERQVRFVAGSLVFIGVLFSYIFNQKFILVSGFIGLGLVFAAITNTCAMGFIISKMPWNTSKNWQETAKKTLNLI